MNSTKMTPSSSVAWRKNAVPRRRCSRARASTGELKAWFEKNSKKFALPSRYSFRHLYFPDKRGKNAQDDAAKALTKSPASPKTQTWVSLADPFMFQTTTATAPRCLG
jgi:hypothetical protein